MNFESKNINSDSKCIEQRREILKIFQTTKRGHISSALSIIDIIRVLYDSILNYQPDNPEWDGRDRFILSKGHGCLALYVVLAEKGFFKKDELYKTCSFEGMLGGHPESYKIPGVEASTGALGHGLSIGVGCAIAARIDDKNHKIFVLVGDGECNEGTIWEAALSAGKHKLSNLTIIVDYNKMQSYSSTYEIQDLEPFAKKWESFGFSVKEINGHDLNALADTFSEIPLNKNKPSVLICHTIKGKGIPSIENKAEWHHKSGMKGEDIEELMEELMTSNQTSV